jgi:hypothetical protein
MFGDHLNHRREGHEAKALAVVEFYTCEGSWLLAHWVPAELRGTGKRKLGEFSRDREKISAEDWHEHASITTRPRGHT